ncbi:MAG: hypothetical protein U0230_01515 [Polyangiales bacterium]
MRSLFLCVLGLGSVLGVSTVTSRASACSPPPPCTPPSLVGDGASLPANAPGFFLDFVMGRPTELQVEVTSGGGVLGSTLGNPTDVPGMRSVGVDLSGLAGSTITIRSLLPCTPTPSYPQTMPVTAEATLAIGPSIPLPTTLGHLSVEHVASAWIPFPLGTGCAASDEVAAIRVTLQASDESAPWLPALAFETRVDGATYLRTSAYGYPVGGMFRAPGGSIVGHGEDLFYAACPDLDETLATEGLAPGRHEVSLRGYFADGTYLETPPIAIELHCAGSSGCAAAATNESGSVQLWLGLAVLLLARVRGARRRV